MFFVHCWIPNSLSWLPRPQLADFFSGSSGAYLPGHRVRGVRNSRKIGGILG